jgi:TusA-related sulfurtransferase
MQLKAVAILDDPGSPAVDVDARPASEFTVDEVSSATFVEALARRDFEAVEATLSPAVRFRGLLPSGAMELQGSAAVAARLSDWFGAAERFEVQEASAELVADLMAVRYRFRLRPHPFVPESGWQVIEQQAFCEIADGKIVALDVLCSGFRPEPEVESGVQHTFDAGTMGCADGLAGEFSRRIRSIGVGDVLTVVARDPAAKEDLPPLARMLGQRVLSVDHNDDGSLSITVERVK